MKIIFKLLLLIALLGFSCSSDDSTDLEEVENSGSNDDTRPYKVITGLITQSGTSAPTLTILENTLGYTPTLSRVSTGDYRMTFSAGIVLANKLWTSLSLENRNAFAQIGRWNNTQIYFRSFKNLGTAQPLSDNLFSSTSIEIRIYE